ncbi:MAG: class I SAM-dependent methyltransferase [Veillonellales bacterium]
MRLRERLNAIAALVPKGARLADIGTDHAYLPITLIQKQQISWAIAGEVHAGPYQSAKETIERLGLQEKIMLRLGDGLSVVTPGEVDTAVIAGMGGTTIVAILSGQLSVARSLNRLILQPMIGAAAVRRWLLANGWCICEESLVVEESRLYEMIAAEPGTSPVIEPILYEVGPILWQKRPPLLAAHIEQLISRTNRILQAMSAGGNAKNSPRYYELVAKVQQLEAKQACL